jgi:hypothetical protein
MAQGRHADLRLAKCRANVSESSSDIANLHSLSPPMGIQYLHCNDGRVRRFVLHSLSHANRVCLSFTSMKPLPHSCPALINSDATRMSPGK